MKKAMLYIHGKGGNADEAKLYKDNCLGYDVIGVDYKGDKPWIVKDELVKVYNDISANYDSISFIGTSVGAYYAMNAFNDLKIQQALLVSPIIDMKKLIEDMMIWANVSIEDLKREKIIETDFNETLSWDYYSYVANHPIIWNVPTSIIFAEKDHLTSIDTINKFVKTHNASLSVVDGAEHYMHSKEELSIINQWIKDELNK